MSSEFIPLTREVFNSLRYDDLVFYRSPGRMFSEDTYEFCMNDGRLFCVCDGWDSDATDVSTEEFLKWAEPLTLEMVKYRFFRGFGLALYVRQSWLRLESIQAHLLLHLRDEFVVRCYEGDGESYKAMVAAVSEELRKSYGFNRHLPL